MVRRAFVYEYSYRSLAELERARQTFLSMLGVGGDASYFWTVVVADAIDGASTARIDQAEMRKKRGRVGLHWQV